MILESIILREVTQTQKEKTLIWILMDNGYIIHTSELVIFHCCNKVP